MSFKEIKAANVNDLKNGEMKNVTAGDGKEVLLCRIDNEYFALSANCTHYGAPLADGVLSGDRIVCPWHHACFNAKNGNLLEPPAQDSLQKYNVVIKNDEVIVRFPDEHEEKQSSKITVYNSESDSRVFAIIGGGAAGNSAVQALRQDGFKGKILFITQEDRAPYDRPNLSKEYLAGEAEEEWMPLRSDDFFKEYGIDLILNKKVNELNIPQKKIKFQEGSSVKYDKVLIATGGKAKKLNLPGENLKNIFTLRSFEDADKIIKAAGQAKNVVVIGASFIGLETTFSLTKRKIPVTVISQELIPFERVFGREVGRLFKNLHEENGVTFKLSRTLKAFEGNDKVEAVALEQGRKIKADLVVMGIGVEPSTGFIKGLKLLPDGSIKTDKYFQAAEDVFAAGDIVTINDWRTGGDIKIEHWRTAIQQGRTAAHNMLGKEIPNNIIPFFWTDQLGLSLQYVGHAKDWNEIIIQGDIAAKNFIAFYLKNGIIYSAAGCGRDKDMAAIEELMRLKKMPSAPELKYDSIDFAGLLSR